MGDVEGPRARVVFVNYRSRDAGWAVHLDALLSERFGQDRVFRASRSIKPSEDFVERILSSVRSAGALVAVIGPGWVELADGNGRPAIHGEQDWVRREIVEALDAGVPVLPVLVADAPPLRPEQLPADLARLARCQYVRFSHRAVAADDERIVQEITRLVPDLAGSGAAGAAGTAGGRRPAGKRRVAVATGVVAAGVAAFAAVTLLPDPQGAGTSRLPASSGSDTTGSGTVDAMSAPWVAGDGPFEAVGDCGPWHVTWDDARHAGVRIRTCARRDQQTQALGVQVTSTDGRAHPLRLVVTAHTCVEGPARCTSSGPSGTTFFPGRIPASAVPAHGTWILVGARSDVADGPHRCIALRARSERDTTFAGSPFRLDPDLVRADEAWQGKVVPGTCPSPPGWPAVD